MIRHEEYSPRYSIGIVMSVALHVLGAFIAVVFLEHSAANAFKPPEIFSVTLEGGERLGGISQAPLDDKPQKIKAVPQSAKAQMAKEEKAKEPEVKEKKVETVKAEQTEKEAEIKAPTAVEEAEKKKKEEQKKIEEQKKLEEEKKEEKKKQEDLKKAEEKEKEDREKLLKQRLAKFKSKLGSEEAEGNYTGESANAGGEGFGAAKLGGKGMGGGILASAEFIAYRNALEEHIKTGWHWMEGGRRLQAQVLMVLSPDGTIENARIAAGSGNSYFDDSVLRAVYKSSPVPRPPDSLVEQFREVRITFDSIQ